jgi:hypothetical protein
MIQEANNEIKMYVHCKQCMPDFHNRKYAVGWTKVGLQVWCETHNLNMLHIDFEGQKHPAITYCKPVMVNSHHEIKETIKREGKW